MADIISTPEIRALLSRDGKPIRLYREQRIEAVLNNKWMSGVIDRLHVHGDGSVVEIIDFKTDRVLSTAELLDRYTSQMHAYRSALHLIHPGAEIHCLVVSTALKQVIRCE
jgi:ATP-dependent exoDNAse (exonuclease V) beta subunit